MHACRRKLTGHYYIIIINVFISGGKCRPHNNNERNRRPSLNQKANKILQTQLKNAPLQCAQGVPSEPMTRPDRQQQHRVTMERGRRRESCCNNAQVIRMPFFAKFSIAEKLAECKNTKPKQKQNQRKRQRQREKAKAKRNVTKRISLN